MWLLLPPRPPLQEELPRLTIIAHASRSGTTLLTRMAAVRGDALCLREPRFLMTVLAAPAQSPLRALAPAFLPSILRAFVVFAGRRGLVPIVKLPSAASTAEQLRAISAAAPRARRVAVVRPLVDIVASQRAYGPHREASTEELAQIFASRRDAAEGWAEVVLPYDDVVFADDGPRTLAVALGLREPTRAQRAACLRERRYDAKSTR